jgi:hypothetical protein
MRKSASRLRPRPRPTLQQLLPRWRPTPPLLLHQRSKAADDKTRTDRQATVTDLEASVVKDAKEKVTAQLLTGPILSASCTRWPVGQPMI